MHSGGHISGLVTMVVSCARGQEALKASALQLPDAFHGVPAPRNLDQADLPRGTGAKLRGPTGPAALPQVWGRGSGARNRAPQLLDDAGGPQEGLQESIRYLWGRHETFIQRGPQLHPNQYASVGRDPRDTCLLRVCVWDSASYGGARVSGDFSYVVTIGDQSKKGLCSRQLLLQMQS